MFYRKRKQDLDSLGSLLLPSCKFALWVQWGGQECLSLCPVRLAPPTVGGRIYLSTRKWLHWDSETGRRVTISQRPFRLNFSFIVVQPLLLPRLLPLVHLIYLIVSLFQSFSSLAFSLTGFSSSLSSLCPVRQDLGSNPGTVVFLCILGHTYDCMQRMKEKGRTWGHGWDNCRAPVEEGVMQKRLLQRAGGWTQDIRFLNVVPLRKRNFSCCAYCLFYHMLGRYKVRRRIEMSSA